MVLVLSACGGSSSDETHVDLLTPTQRIAAITEIENFISTLPGTDQAADRIAVQSFLQSHPAFSAVGLSDDNTVWANFIDGRIYMFVNNRIPAPTTSPSQPLVTSRAYGDQIPGAKVAAFDTMGTLFVHPMVPLKSIYEARGFQFTSGQIQSGTIEQFKAISDQGFVYVDSHGGLAKNSSNQNVRALWTSTEVSPENETLYANDLRSNRLVYMTATRNSQTDVSTRYAMTGAFFRSYVKFAPNSAVLFNACTLGDPSFAADIIASGAGVYFGWSKDVEDRSANELLRFLTDRILGIYSLEPIPSDASKGALKFSEIPNEISSNFSPITNRTYDTSLGTNAKLLTYVGNGQIGSFVPIITRANVNGATNSITITGTFGSTPGTVLANRPANGSGGTPLTIQSWSQTSIRVNAGTNTDTVTVELNNRFSKPYDVGAQDWRLSGPLNGDFTVRKVLTIKLNDTVLFQDPPAPFLDTRSPITFRARPSDTLRITITTEENLGGSSDVFITNPQGQTFRILANALDLSPNPTTGIVRNQSWLLQNFN